MTGYARRDQEALQARLLVSADSAAAQRAPQARLDTAAQARDVPFKRRAAGRQGNSTLCVTSQVVARRSVVGGS